MTREYNIHHLIPTSKLGTNNEQNKKKINVNDHVRRHALFQNSTPVEAICRVLLRNDKVWDDRFIADLINVLDDHLNRYYQRRTHKGFIKSEVEQVLDLGTKLGGNDIPETGELF